MKKSCLLFLAAVVSASLILPLEAKRRRGKKDKKEEVPVKVESELPEHLKMQPSSAPEDVVIGKHASPRKQSTSKLVAAGSIVPGFDEKKYSVSCN